MMGKEKLFTKPEKMVMMGLIVLICTIFYSWNTTSYNNEYVNVTATVNITNAFPIITHVRLDQNILLNAGTTKRINCNVSITEWNGYADIVKVNATLWENLTYTQFAGENNNSNYFNSSCAQINNNTYYANYSCGFDVWYYANASTNWICNVTVMDTWNFTDIDYNTTTIQAYYALNVTPIIDYGKMFLGDYSTNMTANITNFGNSHINISVNGYGGKNPATGNGYAMFCERGNITIANQKFSADPSEDWAAKTALSSTLQNITNLKIDKRMAGLNWNVTFWQLYTDPTNAPFGVCNGTVVFTAVVG